MPTPVPVDVTTSVETDPNDEALEELTSESEV